MKQNFGLMKIKLLERTVKELEALRPKTYSHLKGNGCVYKTSKDTQKSVSFNEKSNLRTSKSV